jgi:ribosomal-protein-alanine N-acetyltransferase
MLKPFTTARLAIRQLQLQDAPELVAISDTPAVSEWMAFMEGGFALERAEALIESQTKTKEYFYSVRLADGTLVGAMGDRSPDGTIASEALRATLDQIAAAPNLATRPIFAECRPDNAASIKLLREPASMGRPGPRPNRIEFVLR